MTRPPPTSPLFPSTTLSQSQPPLRRRLRHAAGAALGRSARSRGAVRSEEHTSELQSRLHLVCRLLLEKKISRPFPERRPGARRVDRLAEALEVVADTEHERP